MLVIMMFTMHAYYRKMGKSYHYQKQLIANSYQEAASIYNIVAFMFIIIFIFNHISLKVFDKFN